MRENRTKIGTYTVTLTAVCVLLLLLVPLCAAGTPDPAVVTANEKNSPPAFQPARRLSADEQNVKAYPADVTAREKIPQSDIQTVKRVAQIINEQNLKDTAQQVPPPASSQNTNPNAILGPVQIDVIDALGTMVIKGHPKDVAAVRAMLKELETMALEHDPIIELVAMQHGDSSRIHTLVTQLYAQVYAARKGSVVMLPLIKPNTIVLIGKIESITAAKDLIAKLDTAVTPDAGFQIFKLKNAASDTLATQITTTFQQRPGYGQGLAPLISVISDYRTNSLIIQGSPRDIIEAATMIQQLDSANSEITNVVKTFPLKNAMASELATTLQNAFSGTSTTGGFGAAPTGAATNTARGALLTLGKVDKDGNLVQSSVLYDVKVAADTRSNTLIVTAPQATMPLIEALINQLDQLPSAESQIKVFTLVNGDAYALTTMLQNLFGTSTTTTGGFGGGTTTGTGALSAKRPGIDEGESTLISVRFQNDIRTNSIIACGTKGDMAVVEALLLRLDADNANNRKVMLVKLVNTPAAQIAPVLQNYVQNERQIDIQNSTTVLPNSPVEQFRKELNIVAEPISNSLIISCSPRYYEQIRKIVKEIDERPLMVAIQVLIAEVTLNNAKETGVELGLQDSILFDRSLPAAATGGASVLPGFLFGNPAQGLPLGSVNAGSVGTQGITSLGVGRTNSTSGIGGFTFSASSESVSILVRALETQNKLRVLSKPELLTMHNLRAEIMVGEEVATSGGTTTTNNVTTTPVEWKKVGTILDITPRIMPDGMVAMALYIEKSRLGTTRMIGDVQVPDIMKTVAQTSVNAMDGQTVVFAGLITEEKEIINRSIPYLNKIPVVKNFFSYDSTTSKRSELLIVLTPTIIRSREDMELLKQQETSRMNWCINDVVRLTGNSQMRLRSDDWERQDVPLTNGQQMPVIQTPIMQTPVTPIPAPTLAPPIRSL